MTETNGTSDAELRQEALRRIKKRHDFHGHLLVYVLVNTLVVVVWLVTNRGGFFYPIILIAGWGIGLVMNAWDAYFGGPVDDSRIEREAQRLQRRRRAG